jgi:hypothetical protein
MRGLQPVNATSAATFAVTAFAATSTTESSAVTTGSTFVTTAAGVAAAPGFATAPFASSVATSNANTHLHVPDL